MVTLLSHPASTRRASVTRARAQRGDIMLVTMVFLLVCLLGLIVSMRDGIVTTLMNGNNLVRQKDVHVADLALGIVANNIDTTVGLNGLPLVLSASAKNWYRAGGVSAAPTAAYWNTCYSATTSTTTSCGTVSPITVGTDTLPYTVYAVVQEAASDLSTVSACAPLTTVYYDVFVHVKESNGATAADTESIYKVCI